MTLSINPFGAISSAWAPIVLDIIRTTLGVEAAAAYREAMATHSSRHVAIIKGFRFALTCTHGSRFERVQRRHADVLPQATATRPQGCDWQAYLELYGGTGAALIRPLGGSDARWVNCVDGEAVMGAWEWHDEDVRFLCVRISTSDYLDVEREAAGG